jgi:hypothetical protein
MSTIAENPVIVETKHRWGKYLLRMAWIIEIIAAIIGLIVAWSMGYQTYDFYVQEFGSFPLIKYLDLILAGLPFVMVASVELLKIPFCFLVYINRSLKVQVAFSVILILVTVITFETLALGFERQFNNISVAVQGPQTELQVIENQIKANEEAIDNLNETNKDTIRVEYQKRILEIEKGRDAAIATLNEQKKTYESLGSEELLEKKRRLQQDRNNLRVRRDDMVQEVKDNYVSISAEEQLNQEKLREDNNIAIAGYAKNIKDRQAWIAAEKLDPTLAAFFGGSVSKWGKEIAEFEKEQQKLRDENTKLGTTSAINKEKRIMEINDEYRKNDDNLLKQISDTQKQIDNESEFKEEIKHINTLIKKRQDLYLGAIRDVDQWKTEEENKLSRKNVFIDKIEAENRKLEPEKTELTNNIIVAYKDTQVYRIAQALFGTEDGGLIPVDTVRFVAKLWFGSLALIVSSMGIFLAFGAFILKHSGEEFESFKKRGSGPIGRAYRKALLAKRKKYRKSIIVTEIKEVIKEVPVNKVEIKEVPKEVIKKEVIHVPIYTNDPDLIKFGTTKVKDILDDD